MFPARKSWLMLLKGPGGFLENVFRFGGNPYHRPLDCACACAHIHTHPIHWLDDISTLYMLPRGSTHVIMWQFFFVFFLSLAAGHAIGSPHPTILPPATPCYSWITLVPVPDDVVRPVPLPRTLLAAFTFAARRFVRSFAILIQSLVICQDQERKKRKERKGRVGNIGTLTLCLVLYARNWAATTTNLVIDLRIIFNWPWLRKVVLQTAGFLAALFFFFLGWFYQRLLYQIGDRQALSRCLIISIWNTSRLIAMKRSMIQYVALGLFY